MKRAFVQASTLLLLGASMHCCFGQRQESLERLRNLPGATEDDRQSWFHYQPNTDIGVFETVKKYEPPATLTLSTRQDFFYTDNVLFSEDKRKPSTGWMGFWGADYVPYSTYSWTPRISLDQYLTRYARLGSADFDSQVLTLASRLDLNRDKSWAWTVSYSLWRLYAAHGSQREFYKHGELENRLNWYHPLTADKSLSLLATGEVNWRHATPSYLNRVSPEVSLRLRYYPHRIILIEPYVRASARFYPTDISIRTNRRDFNIEGGSYFIWQPVKNLEFGAAIDWTSNDSNINGLDYEVMLPVLSVHGSLRF